MSMNRYANAGPIMAGLAAMSEPEKSPIEVWANAPLNINHPVRADELGRMIENVADQLSEIAAQMVDIRKRLDALESEQIAWGKSWFGIEPLPDNYRDDWKARWREQLQAQQAASGLCNSGMSDYYRTSMAGLSELCNAAYGVSAAGKGPSST